MAEKDPIKYPTVFVSDAGAPAGCVNVHDQASGKTVVVARDEQSVCNAIRDLNK